MRHPLHDLVFVDPAGTGFSHLVGDGKPADVHRLREDVRSVASLIREWIRARGRWSSPIFIAGESVGTTRAAARLPELMRGPEPIGVHGVILISQALDHHRDRGTGAAEAGRSAESSISSAV